MFRVPLLVALTLAIAFGGGLWSALAVLDSTAGFEAIHIGAWEAFPRLQTNAADPYAKAERARAGKLLYGGAEGLSFAAVHDDRGEPLTTACRYRISGQTPPARLWTLFVADDGGRPLAVPEGLSSALNSWIVLRNPDSSFSVNAGSQAEAGNWLALPTANRPFRLVLTLLDSPAAGDTQLTDLAMPTIEKIGCGHV